MNRLNKAIILLIILIISYSIINYYDGWLNMIQVPLVLFIVFERYKENDINYIDVILSIFLDFENNLYFGTSLLIFIFIKILYTIISKSISERPVFMLLKQYLFVLIYFVFLNIIYKNNNVELVMFYLIVNITVITIFKFIGRGNLVQSFK
ncbi:hypothetical protein DEFDS_1160 [Deferribacter desulfuricans SSM1]|uniref:Rod shape-determining protein MreD n=1 Tax=Deferribacter desulfuricans (strain DSM 14783 / JCM 11476 / NBRC 101012 / SSM1) TaxID=639282 RepID=D3PDF6_DEFDS|nr:hypothetical protein [Deferribacter desulfuricans]BAI80629.1 hypothetical protein DEFDS_1160 [Deferribacter desulfuricans SSM1]